MTATEAALRDVVAEFWRLSLVIDSAVRQDQPAHAGDVAALMHAARAALALPPGEEWRPIAEAKKDRSMILALLRRDLVAYTSRDDLLQWQGAMLPLRHPGVYEYGGITWDHGWGIALPVGPAGFPDDWIEGWRPLPAPPAQQQEGGR